MKVIIDSVLRTQVNFGFCSCCGVFGIGLDGPSQWFAIDITVQKNKWLSQHP